MRVVIAQNHFEMEVQPEGDTKSEKVKTPGIETVKEEITKLKIFNTTTFVNRHDPEYELMRFHQLRFDLRDSKWLENVQKELLELHEDRPGSKGILIHVEIWDALPALLQLSIFRDEKPYVTN